MRETESKCPFGVISVSVTTSPISYDEIDKKIEEKKDQEINEFI